MSSLDIMGVPFKCFWIMFLFFSLYFFIHSPHPQYHLALLSVSHQLKKKKWKFKLYYCVKFASCVEFNHDLIKHFGCCKCKMCLFTALKFEGGGFFHIKEVSRLIYLRKNESQTGLKRRDEYCTNICDSICRLLYANQELNVWFTEINAIFFLMLMLCASVVLCKTGTFIKKPKIFLHNSRRWTTIRNPCFKG